jgi:hypothetical protein
MVPMATPSPPQLPPSPPTEWPAPPLEDGRADTGWLGVPERESWSGWQVALVTVVALLAGLAIGVALGLRMDRDAERSLPSAPVTDPAPGGPQGPLGPFVDEGAPDDHLGSATNPVPLRTTYILGGYSLQVLAADAEAGPEIAALSDFNVAPAPGQAYLLVTVELTYDGPISGNPLQVLLSAEDASGATYLEHRNSCGRIPDPLSAHADMAPGESVVGNVCFAVPESRLEDMALVAEVLAGFPVRYRLDG